MIKIYIPEINKHRNECLFRPYIKNSELFKEVGIEFVFEDVDCDMVWIGQASYMDKTKSYQESVDLGIKYVNRFKDCDVIMFDGQDSATLMGSWDVFKNTNAKLLLKNTLYKDKYNGYCVFGSSNGRMYCPIPFENYPLYQIPFEEYSSEKFRNVKLSGTNWLSTVQPVWYDYSKMIKDIDVFAMFQYPAQENYEWNNKISENYTEHRKYCIDELKKLPKHIKVVTAEQGKIPINEYYNLMSRSKIVIAPFGYGEIAPRDLESAMLGCVLIKPNMNHIDTIPNIYNDPKNYINCVWNYSNLSILIRATLEDYTLKQQYYVENVKRAYMREYDAENLVTHIYNLIKDIQGYES